MLSQKKYIKSQVIFLIFSSFRGREQAGLPDRLFFHNFATFLRILQDNFETIFPFTIACLFLQPFSGQMSDWKKMLKVLIFRDISYYINFTQIFHSWWSSLSHRNQSVDLLSKTMDWFLYDRNLRLKRVEEDFKNKTHSYLYGKKRETCLQVLTEKRSFWASLIPPLINCT